MAQAGQGTTWALIEAGLCSYLKIETAMKEDLLSSLIKNLPTSARRRLVDAIFWIENVKPASNPQAISECYLLLDLILMNNAVIVSQMNGETVRTLNRLQEGGDQGSVELHEQPGLLSGDW